MKLKTRSLSTAVVTVVAGMSGLHTTAFAQSNEAALEEITVTALRREQNLQEVPISIVAITGEGLETRGITNLEKVSQGIPNVVITGGGGGTGGTSFRMRGIPNVGTYIDNVWQIGTAGFLTNEFVDLDRIEVLRGPQGTMFGRDSTGGAIRIWTKRPGDELAGSLTTTVGSYDRTDIKGTIDVPIGDTITTKFTLASMSRDGYIKSLTTNQYHGGIDQQVKRADIVWEPLDKLSFRLGYHDDYSEFTEPRVQDAMYRTYDDPNPNWVKTLVGQPEFYTYVGTDKAGRPVEPFFVPANQVAGFAGGKVGKWENRSNSTLPNRYDTQQISLETSLDITDDIRAVYLYAKVNQDADSVVDWDNSQYDLVTDINRSALSMTSQELQLTGTATKWVDWMGGLYSWDQETHTRNGRWILMEFQQGLYDINNVLNSPACNPVGGPPQGFTSCAQMWNQGPSSAIAGSYDTRSIAEQDGWAVFGEFTVHATEKMDIILGVRKHRQTGYSQNKAVTAATAPKPALPNQFHSGDPFGGAKTGIPNAFQFEKTTPRVVVQYDFTDRINGYVSYSEGFNSGGVSAPVINGVRTEFPFKPSTLENKEVGIKTELFNRSVRLNVTYFDTIWADLQASGVVTDPVTRVQIPTLVTTNVGEAEAKGVEVELTYVPTDSLLLSLGYGKLDTAYTKIAAGTMSGHLPFTTGTSFEQAPDKSYTLGAQYTSNIGNYGQLVSRFDYNYQGQFWRQPPFLRVSGYAAVPAGQDESGDWGITNLRFSYQPNGQDWEVSAFVTNLADKYMINSGFFHGIWGFDFATVARPREYGVTFRYDF
ncbi:MAG: TonB-dependent receptor [Pseudomonadota bacterium]